MAWNRGDTLKDGKYTIRGVVGQGGFGITYRVRDENRRQFALLGNGLHDAIVVGMELLPEKRPQSIQNWLKLLGASAAIPKPKPEKSPYIPPTVNISSALRVFSVPKPQPANITKLCKGVFM